MQIFSSGDNLHEMSKPVIFTSGVNLHEMSKPVFLEKLEKYLKMSSSENFTQSG